MAHSSSLIALALSLAATVATIGIGAFVLRNAVRDVTDLASTLPTRLISEDTSEVRESNRRKALGDVICLLIARSLPGGILMICGAFLLVWMCLKLLPISCL